MDRTSTPGNHGLESNLHYHTFQSTTGIHNVCQIGCFYWLVSSVSAVVGREDASLKNLTWHKTPPTSSANTIFLLF
jgi:hypothetical protein